MGTLSMPVSRVAKINRNKRQGLRPHSKNVLQAVTITRNLVLHPRTWDTPEACLSGRLQHALHGSCHLCWALGRALGRDSASCTLPGTLWTVTLRATQQHPHFPQNSRCSASAPNRAQSSPNMGVCVCVLSSFPEHHEYLGEEDEH